MATLMNSQSTSSMDVFHHKPLSKQISSHNNVQSNISTPITSANIKPKGVSFPTPSPPRSPTSEKSSPSTTSTQSLASLTPSMSPSSIISLQRSARQEKRHHSHSINVIKQKQQQQQQQILPQNFRRNRSDRSGTFSASENESIQQSSTKKSSKSPLNSNSNNSSSPSNRLSKWASSIRQSFSRSHSTPPPPQSPAASPQHSYLASPPISPVSDKTSIKKKSQHNSPTEKTIEPEYFNAHKKKALDLHLFADKAQKSTASAPEQTVSLQQQSRSTLATSSYPDHPRIRVMNQSRKKIIGSGLIILFCIIAVVILIILC